MNTLHQIIARLRASAWQGEMRIKLPAEIDAVVRNVLNKLSQDYPSLAHINVDAGDPEVMEAQGALATKSLTAIYLHPVHWLDPEKLKAHEQEWMGLMVDPSYAGTIIHECGHILENQVERKLGSKKLNAIIGKYIRDFNGIYNDESPSAYGQENLFEFMAEAFVAHYAGHHGWGASNSMNQHMHEHVMEVCNGLWGEFDKVLK